jgi:hypothetical protein
MTVKNFIIGTLLISTMAAITYYFTFMYRWFA